MSRIVKGRRIIVNCTRACSLHPDNLPGQVGQLVHSWFEEGTSNPQIIAKAALLNVKLSNGSIGRHRANHLQLAPTNVIEPKRPGGGPKKSDLEVLETIIQRGSEQVDLSGTKISAEQLLRAIELKHKLTEGSVFQSFFDAIGAVGDEDLNGPGENPDAIAGADEQAQGAPDA